MMAPQDQYTQNLQNQYNAPLGNQYNTFSAAAVVAPIVLFRSGHSQDHVYLAAKNTFLEFYTEERKAIKRHACARSASCDSTFKDWEQTSTATPTNDSPPSTHRSPGSSDGNLTPTNAGMRSPDSTPRQRKNGHRNNNMMQQYQYQDANQYQDAPCESYDFQGSPASAGGYPMMMVPMMMPVAMASVDEQAPEQEMHSQSKAVKKQDNMPSKKQDLRELNTEPVEEVTTLMIRGIPCSFSQDTLMKLIDNAGLKGKYDFFYLPRAGNNGSNLGYAFINFTNPESAEICTATFNGVPLDPSRSMKLCTMSPADIQGLANLRKHFRRTAVSRGSRGPVFLKVFSEEECNQ